MLTIDECELPSRNVPSKARTAPQVSQEQHMDVEAMSPPAYSAIKASIGSQLALCSCPLIAQIIEHNTHTLPSQSPCTRSTRSTNMSLTNQQRQQLVEQQKALRRPPTEDVRKGRQGTSTLRQTATRSGFTSFGVRKGDRHSLPPHAPPLSRSLMDLMTSWLLRISSEQDASLQ